MIIAFVLMDYYGSFTASSTGKVSPTLGSRDTANHMYSNDAIHLIFNVLYETNLFMDLSL